MVEIIEEKSGMENEMNQLKVQKREATALL